MTNIIRDQRLEEKQKTQAIERTGNICQYYIATAIYRDCIIKLKHYANVSCIIYTVLMIHELMKRNFAIFFQNFNQINIFLIHHQMMIN